MSVVHVLPLNDLKLHSEGGEYCHCKPRIERESEAVIVIHNAYDGREFYEVDPELVAEFGAYHAALIDSPEPPE